MIRVLVVDDEPVVRDGLSMILSTYSDLEVVATAADGAAAWEVVCREVDIDVMLLDLRMPVVDGLTLLRQMRTAGTTRPRVLVLTTFDVDDYVREALQLGAAGFLLKSSPHERIADAVRAVDAGERVLGAGVIETVIGGFLHGGAAGAGDDRPGDVARLRDLTARERQILRLLGEGHSNSAIAAELFVSLHTVKTHVSRVLTKTGCSNRSQAAALALRTARHLESTP